MVQELSGAPVSAAVLLLTISVAIVLAALVAEAAARLARVVLLAVAAKSANVTFRDPIVRRPIRMTRAIVFVVMTGALVPPAFELAGVPLIVGLELAVLADWVLGPGLRVVLIGVVTYLLLRIIASAARRIEDEISHDSGSVDIVERAKRARTLSRLLQNALTVVVALLSLLMVLRELDVDVMPVLTGAGILGLAVGFGAQTLVKDLISGFFLILENQVRVGDVATINGAGGMVEAINLRTTVLRDLEGVVHVFPNGSIERLSNRTKDYSYYVVDVGVAYKEDTDRVADVLRQVGAELAHDPLHGPHVLEPLEVLGVDGFEDSQVVIKIRIKTVPLKQWEVGRELRRRIKKAFDENRIEIPFPHMSVYFGEASAPFALSLRQAV